MTDKINEIRERHLRDEPWRHIPSMICPQAHDDRATLLAEVDRLRAETEQLRDILRRVCVHPSGDRIVKISFISEGCTLTFPVVPSTTWSLEVLTEFEQDRHRALKANP